MNPAEIKFHNQLLSAVKECKKEGYNPSRFVGMLSQSSPFEAVRSLLLARDVSDGFTILWQKGRLDLSVEAIALKPEWRTYFSPDEIATARERLSAVHFKAPWDDAVRAPEAEPVSASPQCDQNQEFLAIDDAASLLRLIASLPGLPERNHEDAVKEFLVRLRFDRSSIVFQKGRIDILVCGHEGTPAAVFEVKRSIASASAVSEARRQGMDYAGQTGALVVVLTDGDRYEVYDRRKSLDYDAMLCGRFQLTKFRKQDEPILNLLRPDRLIGEAR